MEKLGMLGATAAEMAAWFGCGLRTIERRMAEEDGEFRRSYEKGLGRLKISLRRQQIEAAKGGNTAMLIWPGKQMLDQSDRRETKAEATVHYKGKGKGKGMELTPEDEEFLRRKEGLSSSTGRLSEA